MGPGKRVSGRRGPTSCLTQGALGALMAERGQVCPRDRSGRPLEPPGGRMMTGRALPPPSEAGEPKQGNTTEHI